jgi:class 3 adenylate cyclase
MQERFDATLLPAYCALVELAAIGMAPTLAEPLYGVLQSVTERGVIFSRGWVFLIPRILGVAATVNRWWKQAEDHFQCAIDISTNVNAPPELRRTYLDYARMLVARNRKGDRSRAEELVSHASHIFHELGMAPFARDASQLAERLRVRKPQAPQLRTASLGRFSEREVGDLLRERTPTDDHSLGEGTGQALRIILVTVMEGSTALRQRLGDAKSHEILRIHDALIRGCLLQHNGTEVTHTGDGIEASFLSASSAVECAVAIQQAFAQHNREHADNLIRVRIGLNAGEPLPMEGRLLGTSVHTAFRICTRARPEQILASDVIHQLAAGKGFIFIDRGRVRLKGIPTRVRVYEVQWGGDRV